MFVERIPNRKSNPTFLIRESKWVDGRAVKITLANITKLPKAIIDQIRLLLKGGTVAQEFEDMFDVQSNLPHGHVAAVLGTMNHLKIPELIAPRNSRFRRLILGMIAARVLRPVSKLATGSMMDANTVASTLNEELGLKRVDQDDLYDAMDTLIQHKTAMEGRLAKRHLKEGALVLYDVTSSYVEGKKNAWAEFGYNKDKKRGKKQIVIGLMTDQEGCPVGVEVFKGNTADVSTLSTQIVKIQTTFGLEHVVLVGDRGILKQKQLNEEIMPVGLDWVTAMQKSQIRDIVEQENVPMRLFDEQNLTEIKSTLYPKDRLILCKNPLLAATKKEKRDRLLDLTEKVLDPIVEATQRETHRLKGKDNIAERVGKVINKYKMGKFFDRTYGEESFCYARKKDLIEKTELFDGIYAIRSSLKDKPEAKELVANYKRLSTVEIAFRTMKTMSLHVRPIHHRKKERVTAHVWLCMLAYYVEYHMRLKLAPMLFAEENPLQRHAQREDVVAPSKPSKKTKKKAHTKHTATGEKVMSFASVLHELSGVCRMVVIPKLRTKTKPKVVMVQTISATQKRALDLLGVKHT